MLLTQHEIYTGNGEYFDINELIANQKTYMTCKFIVKVTSLSFLLRGFTNKMTDNIINSSIQLLYLTPPKFVS
jgi:hypothetical protein